MVGQVAALFSEAKRRATQVVSELGVSKEIAPCVEVHVFNGILMYVLSKAKQGVSVNLEVLTRKIKRVVRERLGRLARICELYPRVFGGARVIVDAGCGVGLNVMLAGLYGVKGALLVGVDKDSDFLAVFKMLNEEAEAVRADVRMMPLRSGAVDALISTGVIHELPDLSALDEFHRVLRAGGVVMIRDVVLKYVPSLLLSAVRAIKVKLGWEAETPYLFSQILERVRTMEVHMEYCFADWKGPLGVAVLVFRKRIRRVQPEVARGPR